MKINQKILSIPPYISTAWKNVASLHVEPKNASLILIVTLVTGARIEIPHLDTGIIKAAFAAHASSIEMEIPHPRPASKMSEQVFSFGFPLQSNPEQLDDISPLLQHNPEQTDGPDLPPELLEKVTSLSRLLGVKDSALIPHPEEQCNCMHCQISKALHKGISTEKPAAIEEEIVTEEDLKFRTWDIRKTGDKLYSVSNPFDNQEQYSVYLGEPVGCTCGDPHCEHVRAVLNS